MKKGKSREVLLVASGDLRPAANRVCWPAQAKMESDLGAAFASLGYRLVRAHPFKPNEGHGFLSSQKEGMKVFRGINPRARLVVAEAVWQYSSHVLAGLITHKGPLATVANWSGQWPGLVGMLNLNGCLAKAGVRYTPMWADDFSSPVFRKRLESWLVKGRVEYDLSHVHPLRGIRVPSSPARAGARQAGELLRDKAIMGIFDEGCMGMYNAIIPDELLHGVGVFKERLSQSALYYAATKVPLGEARAVHRWMVNKGMKFRLGRNERTDLTLRQVLMQCRMYIAALRIADEFGCSMIGIQYQQGLKDLLPASDLVEGALNNADRPPVRSADGKRVLFPGKPLTHFNEVDECAGLDGLMTQRVHEALRQPVENTLHDVRWGDRDRSGTTGEYVWVFEISGAVPPAHFSGGWKGATGERQPAMYFRLGGSSIKGVSRPGEIVWSRIYVEGGRLKMDLGRGAIIGLPARETERRWLATTPQWSIAHAVLYGIDRDAMMARHKANHIQVAYGHNLVGADRALYAKASMARALGIEVSLCGTRKGGKSW